MNERSNKQVGHRDIPLVIEMFEDEPQVVVPRQSGLPKPGRVFLSAVQVHWPELPQLPPKIRVL